ncbi:hypothetical protein ACFWF3_20310 [Nocardia sp. NPDC060220]|uniref:hypothetical protein n=1 Tax=Nocardia sp. NPDC060220 TaxID=3347076 RepID=UPI0036671909
MHDRHDPHRPACSRSGSGSTGPAGRVSAAYLGGAAMLAVVLISVVLVRPAEHARTRTVAARPR